MNIFKKISLFLDYRRAIIDSKTILSERFNIRVDGAQRLYTVINVPEELVGESYSLITSDINRISENYVRGYNEELSKFLNSKNLNELYEIYEIKKVDKFSYLLVIGFRLFKSQRFYNTIYYVVIPTISLILTTLFFLI
jgi:hypothetical protein